MMVLFLGALAVLTLLSFIFSKGQSSGCDDVGMLEFGCDNTRKMEFDPEELFDNISNDFSDCVIELDPLTEAVSNGSNQYGHTAEDYGLSDMSFDNGMSDVGMSEF
jgi:hypothetical protein